MQVRVLCEAFNYVELKAAGEAHFSKSSINYLQFSLHIIVHLMDEIYDARF